MPIKNAGDDANNSSSMSRAPIPPLEATKGSSSYKPFWPSGFPDPVSHIKFNIDLNNESK